MSEDDTREGGDAKTDPTDPSRSDPIESVSPEGLNRRTFLGVSLGALPAVSLAAAGVKAALATVSPRGGEGALATIPVLLRVNGQERRLRIDPRTSLLDALRDELSLTGTKKGCDHGQCGACTVLMNDRRVLSCLTLAAMASEQRVTTIEGLAEGDRLHPMQAAFIKHDAFQCGYCTPGQIVSAVGLLSEGCPSATADVRECMSGNLCRCGAYPNIVAAIQEVRSGRSS